MQDSSSNIERVLRKAIAAKGAETPEARHIVYNSARKALARHLGPDADPAKARNLWQEMGAAIVSIEADETDADKLDAAALTTDTEDRIQMTKTTKTVEPTRMKSNVALPLAIVVVLASLAAGGWYVLYGKNPNVPVQGIALDLSKGKLTSATSKLTLDPKVIGYTDTIKSEGTSLTLSGWAGDLSDEATPVSILAFAGEEPLGAAGALGKRSDVKNFASNPEIAFKIKATAACPQEAKITVIAVTKDGRYAPMEFWQSEGLCP